MSTRTFVDLGCFNGDSVLEWLKDHPEDEVKAFDPNYSHKNKWAEIEEKYPNVRFFAEAAWVEDGQIEFNQMPPDRPYGSSVMKTKRDWGQGKIRRVPCFDFSNYLKSLTGEIVVKMDIEGSEYAILEKMIKDGTDKLVSKLLVEWHDGKVTDFDPAKKKWIIDNLSCKWELW